MDGKVGSSILCIDKDLKHMRQKYLNAMPVVKMTSCTSTHLWCENYNILFDRILTTFNVQCRGPGVGSASVVLIERVSDVGQAEHLPVFPGYSDYEGSKSFLLNPARGFLQSLCVSVRPSVCVTVRLLTT